MKFLIFNLLFFCPFIGILRSEELLGEFEPSNDPEKFRELAESALVLLGKPDSELHNRLEDLPSCKMKLISVEEAQTQVVAGTNYLLKLKIRGSRCRERGEASNPMIFILDQVKIYEPLPHACPEQNSKCHSLVDPQDIELKYPFGRELVNEVYFSPQ